MSPIQGLLHQGCASTEALLYMGVKISPGEQRTVSKGKDRAEEEMQFLANSGHPIFFFLPAVMCPSPSPINLNYGTARKC